MPISRFVAWAGSVRLAAWLIAALGALSLVAVVVPQRAYLGSAYQDFAGRAPAAARLFSTLGLDRVYAGWPIAIVTALLAVNLTVCTVRRVVERRSISAESATVPAELDDLARQASAEGWTVSRATAGSVSLAKGRSGFWGSVVMHAGLVVIIVGGVATSLTAFRGQAVIAEGQTLVDEPAAYESVTVVPRIGPTYRGTRVTLESMTVEYANGVVVSAVARMRAVEPGGTITSKDVRVNHPLDVGGKSWLLEDSGYVARVVVRVDEESALPLAVKLASETPYGWQDDIVVPTPRGDVALSMAAAPRPVDRGEPTVTEKLAIRDPRLVLVVEHAGKRWEGELAPGQTSGTVGGVTVVFEGLGLWSRFLVRGEPARWVTYTGFWLVVIGALWRFMVPEHRAAVRCSAEGRAEVTVRTYPWMRVRRGGPEVLLSSSEERTMRSRLHEEDSAR